MHGTFLFLKLIFVVKLNVPVFLFVNLPRVINIMLPCVYNLTTTTEAYKTKEVFDYVRVHKQTKLSQSKEMNYSA